MNISARLVINGVIAAQKEYELSTQPVVIGRENVNDLVLKDPEVSRRHARITYQAGRYYVEDLNSTNGTFLNDQPVRTQSPLNHGDVIRLGESIRLTYYGLAAETADETFILEDPQDRLPTPPLPRPGGYQQPQYQPPPQPQQPAYGSPPGRPPYSRPEPFQQQSQGFGPPAEPRQERSTGRIVLGCGCLLILAFIACGASLYLLDSFAPDLLYCGVLEPVVRGLGVSTLVCP
jgi:hypothetical protein